MAKETFAAQQAFKHVKQQRLVCVNAKLDVASVPRTFAKPEPACLAPFQGLHGTHGGIVETVQHGLSQVIERIPICNTLDGRNARRAESGARGGGKGCAATSQGCCLRAIFSPHTLTLILRTSFSV